MNRKWIKNSSIAWTYGSETNTGLTNDGSLVWIEEKDRYVCTHKGPKPAMYVYGKENFNHAKKMVEGMVEL